MFQLEKFKFFIRKDSKMFIIKCIGINLIARTLFIYNKEGKVEEGREEGGVDLDNFSQKIFWHGKFFESRIIQVLHTGIVLCVRVYMCVCVCK